MQSSERTPMACNIRSISRQLQLLGQVKSILLASPVVFGVESQCHSALSGFAIAHIFDHCRHLGQSDTAALWIIPGGYLIFTVLGLFSIIQVASLEFLKIIVLDAIGAAVVLAFIQALIFLLESGQIAGGQGRGNQLVHVEPRRLGCTCFQIFQSCARILFLVCLQDSVLGEMSSDVGCSRLNGCEKIAYRNGQQLVPTQRVLQSIDQNRFCKRINAILVHLRACSGSKEQHREAGGQT